MEIHGLTLETIKKVSEMLPTSTPEYKLILMKQEFMVDGKVVIQLSPNDYNRFCELIDKELKDGKKES